MKNLIFIFFLAFTTVAHAESSGESRLHLPKSICHQEENEKLDSAPQSPPLIVDDPETPGCNRWEINVLMSTDYSKIEKHYDLPLLDINYGLGDDIEIMYEVPNSVAEADGQTHRGIGESNFGIKYRFYSEEESDTNIAIYPQYQFVTPNSRSVESEIAEPGVIVALPLLFSKRLGSNSLGDIVFAANLGYNFSTKAELPDFISAVIGFGMPVRSKISMMAELTSEKSLLQNSSGIRAELYRANLGFITTFVKHVLVFGSVGQSLSSSDNVNHTYVLAGIRVQQLSSLVFW